MARLKKLECTILLGGQTIHGNGELEVDDSETAIEYGQEIKGNTITTSIVAIPGKTFAFNLDFSKHQGRLDIDTYADGILQDDATFVAPFADKIPGTYRKQADGTYHFHQFVFGTIHTVERSTLKVEKRTNVLKALGTFELLVYRSEPLPGVPVRSPLDETKGSFAGPRVLKSSLEGRIVDCRTMLKAVVKQGNPEEVRGEAPDGTRKLDETPYVKFVFRYKSLEALQAEGLIPSNSSPQRSSRQKPTEQNPASVENQARDTPMTLGRSVDEEDVEMDEGDLSTEGRSPRSPQAAIMENVDDEIDKMTQEQLREEIRRVDEELTHQLREELRAKKLELARKRRISENRAIGSKLARGRDGNGARSLNP